MGELGRLMMGTGKITYFQMSRLVAGLEAENAKLRRANARLAPWMSAALEAANEETKDIINRWFEGVNDAPK